MSTGFPTIKVSRRHYMAPDVVFVTFLIESSQEKIKLILINLR